MLSRAGGTPARGTAILGAPQPVQRPFATGTVVEGTRVAVRPVAGGAAAPEGTGFADGIQRWGVEGHFGLVPVIRAQVAAAVLVRHDGALRVAHSRSEEFLAVPADRLSGDQHAALADLGVPVHDVGADTRPHPLLDRWEAAQLVERRREAVEVGVCRDFLAGAEAPLVVDGGLRGIRDAPGAARAIGIVKHHETQFLEGPDLEVALTLPEGARTSVFARRHDDGTTLLSWYLRLWPWTNEDLLHGLTRVERVPDDTVVPEADRVSGWLLAERAPIAGRDPRWDRLLYPLHEVEAVLRARAGGWL